MTKKELRELLGTYPISKIDFENLYNEANSINEEWADIENFYGYYQISNMGRLKSLERTQNGRHGPILRCEKIIKGSCNNGYHIYGLHKNNTSITLNGHRLVGEYFLPNPNNKPEINHKYGNKSNNRIWNLEWATKRENQSHWRLLANSAASKYIGVSRNVNGKWKSCISINGKELFLGYYYSEEEAAIRYLEELNKLGVENKYAKFLIK